MAINDKPLGGQGVKDLLRLLHKVNWRVSTAGTAGYAAKPPNSDDRVLFNRNDRRSTVYMCFRRLGLETDPRELKVPRFNGKPNDDSPFASLAPMLDEVTQRPLIEIAESTKNKHDFSDHALTRMMERNIGVFEVWAALQAPEYSIPERSERDVVHHLRGDIEVVVSRRDHTVVTVIDMLEKLRTEPRIALAPEVPIPRTGESTDMTADPAPASEPTPEANFDISAYRTKAAALRAWVATHANGEEFTSEQAVQALRPPGDASHAWLSAVDSNTSRLTMAGYLARLEQGRYRVLDAASIAAVPGCSGRRKGTRTVPRKLWPDRNYADKTTARTALRRYIDGLAVDAPFTFNDVFDAVQGFSVATMRKQIAAAVDEGSIYVVEIDRGVFIYAKSAPVTTTKVPPKVEAKVEPKVEAKAEAEIVDIDEDYDVTVGFSFESLRRSDLFDLMDVVAQHRKELQAHPGSWARIATYHGDNAVEVATKRAGRLDYELNDSSLQFQARRVGVSDAAMFVSWSPASD